MFSNSKREFLKLLGVAGGAAVLPSTVEPGVGARSSKRVRLLESHIAGIWYYEVDSAAPFLKPSGSLVLRREPKNPFDKNAIEVLTAEGMKLGYVRKVRNPAIAAMMDAGLPVTARIGEDYEPASAMTFDYPDIPIMIDVDVVV